MLCYNLGFVCDDNVRYLTFKSKSQARDWLLKNHYVVYKDFPDVWFNSYSDDFDEYRIRKFLNLPFYGIVREYRNKREFLHYN